MTLQAIRDKAVQQWQALQNSTKPVITVGTATCGRSAGALEVMAALEEQLSHHEIDAEMIQVGCLGLCYAEPLITMSKPGLGGICYGNVTPRQATALVEGYLVNENCQVGKSLGSLGHQAVGAVAPLEQTPVFKHQVRRTLAKCGLIDPTNLDH